jgi:hypothetical protein
MYSPKIKMTDKDLDCEEYKPVTKEGAKSSCTCNKLKRNNLNINLFSRFMTYDKPIVHTKKRK